MVFRIEMMPKQLISGDISLIALLTWCLLGYSTVKLGGWLLYVVTILGDLFDDIDVLFPLQLLPT